ncbi:hypothetical protein RFI_37006 [Reticulomyxa filosa]|uniref:Uncharacterized protein n=1 Tax=Reticulomyxa filosa TaxID=46433 RepID=X6LEN9_RETFI|nr:hypothetical protein RFI_37006 [Reticulomyxa filosa]|eukprot:ETO00438.1 hypothetical protein RFI_37006 [Reticulomyxa filosa]
MHLLTMFMLDQPNIVEIAFFNKDLYERRVFRFRFCKKKNCYQSLASLLLLSIHRPNGGLDLFKENILLRVTDSDWNLSAHFGSILGHQFIGASFVFNFYLVIKGGKCISYNTNFLSYYFFKKGSVLSIDATLNLFKKKKKEIDDIDKVDGE